MNRAVKGKLGELTVYKALIENGIVNLFIPLNPTQSQCDIIALSDDYKKCARIEVKYIHTKSKNTNLQICISNNKNFNFDFLIMCIKNDSGENEFWIIGKDELEAESNQKDEHSKNEKGVKIKYSITKSEKCRIYMKNYTNQDDTFKTTFINNWNKIFKND